MTAGDIVIQFVDAFDRAGVPYMLVGSYSSNYYGRPRSTKDADFVVQLPPGGIAALSAALGGGFRIDPQMSFETVTATTRYVATHDHSAFMVEMFPLSDDAHDRERFARRAPVPFEGRTVYLPTAEDVVVTKLRWARGGFGGQDVRDAAAVLALQRNAMDLTYVRRWCDAHGTRDRFERVLADVVAGPEAP